VPLVLGVLPSARAIAPNPSATAVSRATGAAASPAVILTATAAASPAVTPAATAAASPASPAATVAASPAASPAPSGSPALDTTPPGSTITGALDGSWHNTPVTLMVSAADEAGGSGVAALVIVLDGVSQTLDTPVAQVLIGAPADHHADGLHTLAVHAIDAAGNAEAAHAVTIGIDTRRPTVLAPAAASTPQYGVAKLRYEVVDDPPNGGTADVTIRLRDRHGKVVATVKGAAQPVGKPLLASFDCALAVGVYRFTITAVDAAGNRQVAAAANRLTVRTSWSSGLPFRFRVGAISLRDLDPSALPLLDAGRPIAKADRDVHDAQGVRMFWHGGRLHNHPVGQAVFGLRNLRSYQLTHDAFYLRRAQAQAQRLIARRRVVGSAWLYPYDFPFGIMTRTPWYSGMSQGLALPLFDGLFQVTGRAVYQQAARATLASFLRRGPSAAPWVANVDAGGYLWLQEYPASSPDYTLNGFIYAAIGLYDYYRTTGDRRASELFKGAATTVAHYAHLYRRPGWLSYYCLAHHDPANDNYHQIHVHEFLTLYRITGKLAFARLADAFERDYPEPAISGAVRVTPGTYQAMRFDPTGALVARRPVQVAHTLRFAVKSRARIRHESGYWFAATSGPFAGWLLREQPGRVYRLGVLPFLGYLPSRTVTLPGGHTYVGHTYDARGVVTGTTTLSAATATRATANRRATVNGRDEVHLDSGPLNGCWLPLGPARLN
jgi:hypothetical protein